MVTTSNHYPHSVGGSFLPYARTVRRDVSRRLAAVLEQRIALAEKLAPDVVHVLDSLKQLAVRGGKRLRAVLLAAAYEACGGEGGSVAVVDAGVALEVLQAYLLVHDDWMDGDDVRRGGPSAHALLRERFGSNHEGDAGAILAGDFGSSLALDVLAAMSFPPARLLEAIREFGRAQCDVVLGQIMDVRHSATTETAVEAMHRLKTGSYTVRGPLLVGACLAGASKEIRAGLTEVADPLGIAFQLRDDLLGTFGDPARTGKPASSDLREGKRTALIIEMEKDREAARMLPRVLGVADAPDEEVAAVVRRMVDSGAKSRVEARIGKLLDESRERLGRLPLQAEGKAVLMGAVAALGSRDT